MNALGSNDQVWPHNNKDLSWKQCRYPDSSCSGWAHTHARTHTHAHTRTHTHTHTHKVTKVTKVCECVHQVSPWLPVGSHPDHALPRDFSVVKAEPEALAHAVWTGANACAKSLKYFCVKCARTINKRLSCDWNFRCVVLRGTLQFPVQVPAAGGAASGDPYFLLIPAFRGKFVCEASAEFSLFRSGMKTKVPVCSTTALSSWEGSVHVLMMSIPPMVH